jgi:hypothetical protein
MANLNIDFELKTEKSSSIARVIIKKCLVAKAL